MKTLIQNGYHHFCSAKYRSKSGTVIFCILIIALTTCTEVPEVIPKLIALETVSTDITSGSAILKGEIKTPGNMNIIEYGIEISKNMLLSPSVTKGYSTPAVTGIFQVEFTGLEPNTLYYFKAYATVNTAQVYSENIPHFTTKPARK